MEEKFGPTSKGIEEAERSRRMAATFGREDHTGQPRREASASESDAQGDSVAPVEVEAKGESA